MYYFYNRTKINEYVQVPLLKRTLFQPNYSS